MNEFDELFNENKPTDSKKQESVINDFNEYVNRTEKNGLLLLIYIIVSLLFSYGLQLTYNNTFPDTTTIDNNLYFINDELDINMVTNDSEIYPYLFEISGEVASDYEEELPLVYVSVIFYNSEGTEIGYYYQQLEDFSSDDRFIINGELASSVDYSSCTYDVGFDLAPTTYTLYNLLPVLISSILFFLVDWSCFKHDAIEFKNNKKKYILQIVSGFVMVYAALLVANIILEIIGVYVTSQNEMTISSMFTDSPLQLVLLFFLLCVFTPIVEEVVFRKIIFTFVEPKLGHITAIISTGLIFGIMHVAAYQDFIQAIPYVFMGLTFGYIYWRANKNIYVTIGVHFLNNLLSYVIYFAYIVFGISI